MTIPFPGDYIGASDALVVEVKFAYLFAAHLIAAIDKG
jgi:hypothetical protein